MLENKCNFNRNISMFLVILSPLPEKYWSVIKFNLIKFLNRVFAVECDMQLRSIK